MIGLHFDKDHKVKVLGQIIDYKLLIYGQISGNQKFEVEPIYVIYLICFQYPRNCEHSVAKQTLATTEEAIKNGQSRDNGNIGHIKHRTKTSKTGKHNTENKKMSNTHPNKNRGCTQMLANDKQFLVLIRNRCRLHCHNVCASKQKYYVTQS